MKNINENKQDDCFYAKNTTAIHMKDKWQWTSELRVWVRVIYSGNFRAETMPEFII